jgi:hypothetical protein
MGIEDRQSKIELPKHRGLGDEGWTPWFPQTSEVKVTAGVLAIPLTALHVSKTTGGIAEALTLANGKRGQMLIIDLEVPSVGVGTLTPDTSTGWATIVFADAGDQATLLYVDDTIGWVILGLAGVAAPPAITI